MTTQKGFAHTFLIIGLGIVLIGLLGFVFWQNFIQTEKKTDNPEDQSKTQRSEPKQTIALNERYTMPAENLSFKYPSTWSLQKEYKANPYGDDNTADLTAESGLKLSFIIPSYGPDWQFGERIYGCPFDDDYDPGNQFNQPSLCPTFKTLYSAKSKNLDGSSVLVFSRTYPAGSAAKPGIDFILAKDGCEGTDRALCERPAAKTGFYVQAGGTAPLTATAKFMASKEAKEAIAILESIQYQE